MIKVKFVTLVLFVCGLAQAADLPCKNTPLPKVSDKCQKAATDKVINDMVSCAQPKIKWWADRTAADIKTTDTAKALFYACCYHHDMEKCEDSIKGSCTEDDMTNVDQFIINCAHEINDKAPVVTSCTADYSKCPGSGSTMLTINMVFMLAITLLVHLVKQ